MTYHPKTKTRRAYWTLDKKDFDYIRAKISLTVTQTQTPKP